MTSFYLYETKTYFIYWKEYEVKSVDFRDSDLFIKYTHTPKFKLIPGILYLYMENSWWYFGNHLTVNIDGRFKGRELTSIDVFFNRYYTEKIVLFRITLDNNEMYHSYFKTNRKSTINISELIKFEYETFITKLIEENDIINNTITYQIHQKTGEYSNRIDVQKHQKDPSYGFTEYTHKPSPGHTGLKCFVLYNEYPLNDEQQKTIQAIQNKEYSQIHVYFSDKFNKLLQVCLINSDKECYQFKISGNKYYFKKTDENENQTRDQDGLAKTLQEAESHLVETIAILLDKQGSYKKRDFSIIDGISNRQPESILVFPQKDGRCNELKYKYYEHILPHSFSPGEIKIQPFISTRTNHKRIELYNSDGNTPESIYYDMDNNRLFVYFYNSDPRPLLVCYKDTAYKPDSLKEYTSKWVKVDGIKGEKCKDESKSFKDEIRKIHDVLNQVNISKTSEYNIHEHQQYPIIKIIVTSDTEKSFNKYTHKATSGSELGNIVFNKGGTDHKVNYESSNKQLTSVTSYYYKHDSEHENPLLVELELKGTDDNTTTKEFYELNSNRDGYSWTKSTELNKPTTNDQEAKSKDQVLDKLSTLNTKYNSDKPPDESESNENIPIIVGVTVPTAGLGSGGIAAYFYRGSIAACLRSTI